MQALFGTGVCDGPVDNNFYRAFDIAMRFLSELSGDEGEWIQYWFYERSIGSIVKVNNVEMKCNTTGQLWEIIHADVNEGVK